MPRLTKFEEYCDRYSDSYVLEKTDDGILLVRMHTDGGPVNWNKAVLATPDLFGDIAGDRDVRIVIYTGTGRRTRHNCKRRRSAPPRMSRRQDGSGGTGTTTCWTSTRS